MITKGGIKVSGDRDRVDQGSTAYRAMIRDVKMCRDLFAGTSAVKDAAQEYLPKAAAEEYTDYQARLRLASFFNAFGRSVAGLTGLVFRDDPQFVNVSEAIEADLENIDAEGSHVAVFAKNLFEDALTVGHSAILVDVPQNDGVRSLAAERAAGIRPIWRMVKKENIVSWRFIVDSDGRRRLTQAVIYDPVLEPVGEFKEVERHIYRVYRRSDTGIVTFQEYEIVDDKQVVLTDVLPVTNVTAIPLVPVYGGAKTGFFTSRPPLIDLAHTNVAHYQVRSDHLWGLHAANVPTMVLTGVNPDSKIKIGFNSLIKLPDPQSRAEMVEHSGASFTATKDMEVQLIHEMAVLGLAMLQHETRQAETAEGKRIDKAEQDSSLATAGRSLADALENALMFHAQFMRVPGDGGEVIMNREYEAVTLDANDIAVYSNMVATGQISLTTMWKILQEGGRLPDDFDPEAEAQLIATEGLLPIDTATE